VPTNPPTTITRFWKQFLGGIALLTLFACSSEPPTSEVRGTVTYKGELVPAGMITFMAADQSGRADTGSILNGNYTLPRAPIGKVKIQVFGSSGNIGGASLPKGKRRSVPGQLKLAQSMGGKIGEALPEFNPTGKPFKVPAKYANADTSGLTYEVLPGDQTYDINLP
jgi:hypothetical protein